ncbi:hypothetical protein U1Q18_037178 [Sarracenia purpurea var. burkii]
MGGERKEVTGEERGCVGTPRCGGFGRRRWVSPWLDGGRRFAVVDGGGAGSAGGCGAMAGGRIEENDGDGRRRTDLGEAGAVRRCGRRRWWKPRFTMVGQCLGFRNPLLLWSPSICRR